MPLLETKGVASAQGFGFSLQRAGAVQAEAIDFDGTNDFLSRSTDLVGNVNGNTFTFSVWVWRGNQNLQYIYNSCESSTSTRFSVELTGSSGNNAVRVIGKNTSGSTIFSVTSALVVGLQTWTSVIVSGNNNTNVLDIAINDVRERISDAFTSTNSIAFAQPIHNVAQFNGDEMQTRLSNVFLDYTYRDLSITANRRLFVTADLKPAAGQAALNPILYLPMSDPTNPGLNTGTGGNFTLTGVVARSGRGPNQYNAPYSNFDGIDNMLARSSTPSGLVDGKQFTFQCAFIPNNIASNNTIISFSTVGNQRFAIWHNNDGQLTLFGRNSSGTTILNATVTNPTFIIGRNYVVTVSVDLADFDKKHIYINGVAATTVSWNTYTNDNIDFAFTAEPTYNIGCANDILNFFNGRLGALWFTTTYIDLSVAANRAKFVAGTGINAAPADLGATGELPTGTSAIIYLPLYGNLPSKNYGTGGDIAQFGGIFAGSRGPNEYWGNKIQFPSGQPSANLNIASLAGIANTTTFSFTCFFIGISTGAYQFFSIDGTVAGYFRLRIAMDNGQLKVLIANSSDTGYQFVFNSSSISLVTLNAINSLQFSRNGTSFTAFLNNVSVDGTVSPNTGAAMTVSGRPAYVGTANPTSGNSGEFQIAEVYFTTTYINFNQEAERLKFRDAFGNPVNLTQQIEALAIPNPVVYLRFPPGATGTNYGTGGNFSGTRPDAGQL